MRNKYIYYFHSENEPAEKFTLTFTVHAAHKSHVIEDLKVYQHKGDAFCHITNHTANPFRATSITNCLNFDITIIIMPTGVEIFVSEFVISIIAHTPNLQPCN